MNANATLLVCGQILTLDPNNTVIEDGAVAIAGDTIVEVGERMALSGKYSRGGAACPAPWPGHAGLGQQPHPCGHGLFPGAGR